jgi:hypothetical protein
MATTLTAVGSRLDAMEVHPALRLTPDLHAREIAAGGGAARNEASDSAAAATRRLQEAAEELGEMIGAVRTGTEQRRRVLIALAIGAALGFVAWWPLTAVLPWGGGAWLAATLMDNHDRWETGQALMRGANPLELGRMVRLYNACPSAITAEQCEAAMAAAASPAAPPVPPPEAVKPGRSADKPAFRQGFRRRCGGTACALGGVGAAAPLPPEGRLYFTAAKRAPAGRAGPISAATPRHTAVASHRRHRFQLERIREATPFPACLRHLHLLAFQPIKGVRSIEAGPRRARLLVVKQSVIVSFSSTKSTEYKV